MTDEMIMGELSKGFLSVVGARRGYKSVFPSPDTGVDQKFIPSVPRVEPNGQTRWLDSDKNLDVQLKCVHRRRVTVSEDRVIYDLEAKNFNDLVHRRSGLIPFYLVLLIVPDEHDHWVGVTPEQLAVRECAYWWRPAMGTPPTANVRTVRIEIPQNQRVTIDFLPERFVDAYGAER